MLKRFVMTDLPQEMAELQAALEADMAMPALAKESYHHQQIANLEARLAMSRCGVKVLAEPVAEPVKASGG